MLLAVKKFTSHALNYPRFLFCGSFNPMHKGHIAIADYVSTHCECEFGQFSCPIDFEISLNNVEKHHIDMDEVERRFVQMGRCITPAFGKLYVTEEPRYLEKARLFPDVTFVCGFDTIQALCSGQYYKGDEFNKAIEEFDELGTKWIAFHRKKASGQFSTEEDFQNFPEGLRKNLTVVSSDEFPLMDISSRQIRARDAT